MARTTRKTFRLTEEFAFYLAQQFFAFLRTSVICITVGICFTAMAQALILSAGKETIFKIALSFIGDIRLSIAITLTGLATLWAIYERKTKQRTIGRLTARNKELELIVDPGRTSSGLTSAGTTNPKDRRV